MKIVAKNIPKKNILNHSFIKDNYIQIPNLKKFCKKNGLSTSNLNRIDLINDVEKYAKSGEKEKKEVVKWALETIKAGSKEFCYRKIYKINKELKNPENLKKLLESRYPDCPFQNVLDYKNTDDLTLIDYEIKVDENNQVKLVSFEFSGLVYEGIKLTTGNKTIYPVYVDIYIDEEFIVSRLKPKSTIYKITESEQLSNETHINTQKYAINLIDELMEVFRVVWDNERYIIQNKILQMHYKLYEKYSFTPQNVKEKMNEISEESDEFASVLFSKLGLSKSNLGNAIQDLEILAEKYISINGDNEEIFKNDRDAYLVKVVSDDEQEMTRVDTSSQIKPLQCTEAFFDSKKAIIKSKQCDRLHLCFKRHEKIYFIDDSICVQFLTKRDFGLLKFGHYAEEEDINRVLRTIFENY